MSQPVATVRGEATLQGLPDLAGLSVTVHRSGDSAGGRRRADDYAAAFGRLIIEAAPPARTPDILKAVLVDLERR